MATSIKVTENNVLQLIADYAVWKYGEDAIMQRVDECPHKLDFDNEEFVFKQVLSWFIREWKNPDTGKTPLEEFVEDYLRKERVLAEKVLGTLNLVTGTFVIRGRKDNIIEAMDPGSRIYDIWVPPQEVETYIKGRNFVGTIFQWGDVYRFSGITLFMKSDKQIFMEAGIIMPGLLDRLTSMMLKGEMEEIILRRNATAASVLNKFSSWMVDNICHTLHILTRGKKKNQKVKEIAAILDSPHILDIIKALPQDARNALDMVRMNDGLIGYGKLVRKFGEEDVGTVNEGSFIKPKTVVGILRMHGLLVVGKMAKGDRFYNVAMIPKEVMQRLENA